MANITKDDIWKVFSLIMSVLVLPLAGWVWNTNVKVAELQNDLGDAEQQSWIVILGIATGMANLCHLVTLLRLKPL